MIELGKPQYARGPTPHPNAELYPRNHYDFDVRPHCAYWLSLEDFSSQAGSELEIHAFSVDGLFTYPYLTVEFRSDDIEQSREPENRLVAAAGIAPYNRFLLRRDTFGIAEQDCRVEHIVPSKHFGITWSGEKYMIWCISARITSTYEWNGCHVESTYIGYCSREEGVRTLIDWVNEIHCWGLTVYGL